MLRVQRIKEELSAVVIYYLSMANRMDIDLSSAIFEKLKSDGEKYPVGQYKGKAHLDH